MSNKIKGKRISESDFDWAEETEILTVGTKYDVRSPNGIYWETLTFSEEVPNYKPSHNEEGSYHMYKFKDNSGTRHMSKEHFDSLIDSGFVRIHDPEWSIVDEVEFGSMGDISGRNFVIYFENGVSMDETIQLQKKLRTMGFTFPGHEGVITSKDADGEKAIMFECYNWDNTNKRYESMPNDFRDKGLMLIVNDKKDSWLDKDLERKLQNRFSTVIDHNAIVVDGTDLLNNMVNESNDFDWVDSVPDNPVRWVEPKVTLDTVDKDESGWPYTEGIGEGEVWVDFEKYTNDERIEIIYGIEEYIGTELGIYEGGDSDSRDIKILTCTSNRKKGLIIHCGSEDNHYFAKENHTCCMGETYDEFMNAEFSNNPNTVVRPRVDGGLFLNKEKLTEEYKSGDLFYKGPNPTVDLIVIRGDKVLLIQRANDADTEPGKWAIPGGFHDSNAKKGEEWKEDKESSLEAAKREVKEETGLDVDTIDGLNFNLVGVYEGGGRDPRDWEESWTRSTVYMVHIPETEGGDVKGMDDAQRAEWVPISKVLQHKLAFDHHKIVEKAISMNESDAFFNGYLLTESGDFDWVQEVTHTDESIRALLSNCEDIPVTNYNIPYKSAFTKRGKMNIMYYSMCPYWWDKLKDEPQDENGRGKGEWFQSYSRPDNSVAVIMPDRNGVTDIRNMDVEDYSAITYDLKGISNYFNGKGSELWIFLDDEGHPRYDLIPQHFVDDVRKAFEGVDVLRTLEESNDFDWTDEIEGDIDEDLYLEVADAIDNEVSQGPHYDRYVQSQSFRDLNKVLQKHNINTDDMSDFFTFGEPKDEHGNYITNNQLRSLKTDLIKIGVMLTDEDQEEMNESDDFGWTKSIQTTEAGKWLKVGQKFTNVNNYRRSKDYEPKDKVQVGTSTFEIFHVGLRKDADNQYLMFTHNDVLERYGKGYGMWDKEKEIKNGYGTTFKQAYHNIDSGFWIPLENCEFIPSTHPSLVGKVDSHGNPYGSTYCTPNTSSKIQESNDFDWAEEIPANDLHRYFDINVCYQSFYDDDTGEDECVEGGSYFLKIPGEVVPSIWDYEAEDDYIAGPGDEGEEVIKWCIENGLLDDTDYADVEYVTELSKSEYCRAWGNWNDGDEILCGRNVNESTDFDWTEDIEPWTPGEKYVIDFTTEDEDTSGYLGFGERKRRMEMKKVLAKLGYETRNLEVTHCFYYLEDYKSGLVSDEKWVVGVDDCGDDEHMEYIHGYLDEYEIYTPTQFFDATRGSITESNDFDWAEDDVQPFHTLDWEKHPLVKTGRESFERLEGNPDFTAGHVVSIFDDLKQGKKEWDNGQWISIVSGPNWYPSSFDGLELMGDSEKLGYDLYEVFSSHLEESRIMDKHGINQHMDELSNL